MKNTIIQITAGRGPAECRWVVAQVLKILLREADQECIEHEIIQRDQGNDNGTLNSVIVKLEGNNLKAFLDQWLGTVQWVGQSKFRKLHKRKNWFIGINQINDSIQPKSFRDKDIRYEFTRSGGPGGQHVNKVSTAVRATHIPSGEVVFVSQGRSQLQNKHEARRRLMKQIEESSLQTIKERIKDEWINHQDLIRGNPIRTFKGSDFKPNHQKKEHKSSRKRIKQALFRGLDE